MGLATLDRTTNEIVLDDDEFIVSKTDLFGNITYVNRVFMEISGYSESELLGKNHNIVRHSDMPRGVYHFLWQTLKQKDEFFGFVKNQCKDGSFYWVFANITPDYDNNQVLKGYYSVRRKPSRRAVQTIEPIYAEMMAAEKSVHRGVAAKTSYELLLNKLEQQEMSYFQFVMQLDCE